MRYIPNSPEERAGMLAEIGLSEPAELFRSIPADLRLNRPLSIIGPLAETEVLSEMNAMAGRNTAVTKPSFLGGGVYAHYSPTIVDHLIQRSEFFTSYTPYQPEISQGTLQYIFEFQTLICQLTGMEVANASMYDGSTAMAEAYLMAQRVTQRNKIIVADSVHPQYRQVAETYTQHGDAEIFTARHNPKSGRLEEITGLDSETAAVVVQSPNFFGCIEDLAKISEAAHSAGAMLIVVVTEALSLGILKPPGAFGADIVVGEGQSFGIPMSFGGPHVGLFATQEKFIRQMPGRLCGIAYDKSGRRGFVLTLSTREQHIRREKATSNICTNQGLIALAATIYMETLGRKGLREVAGRNLQNAAFAIERISAIEGYSIPHKSPTFNEFVVRGPRPAAEILETLRLEFGILGGIALSDFYPDRPNDFLVCTTELNTRSQIESLGAALHQIS